jgi:hypothetical protein
MYSFEEADPRDLQSWQRQFTFVMKKVGFRRQAAGGRRQAAGGRRQAAGGAVPARLGGPLLPKAEHQDGGVLDYQAPMLRLPAPPQVTYWAGGSKPLLIKSPVHTGRIKLLLRLFPKARFLYIHRNPIKVDTPGWESPSKAAA